MNQDKMYDLFEQYCHQIFEYLKIQYDFKSLKTTKSVWGCTISYKKRNVIIYITYSPRERDIFFSLKKELAISHILPYYPGMTSFYLDELIYLRTSQIVKKESSKLYQGDFKYIQEILNKYSEALKLYADGVLKGDLSLFKEIVKARKQKNL